MRIFYEPEQFPHANLFCHSNHAEYKLSRDIEFIPADFNLILLDDDVDKADWLIVLDHWTEFIKYLVEVIKEFYEDEIEEKVGDWYQVFRDDKSVRFWMYSILEIEFEIKELNGKFVELTNGSTCYLNPLLKDG